MLVLALAALVAAGIAVAAVNGNFSVHTKGKFEVPATSSKGQGQAIFHLSKDGDSLSYKLNVANIDDVTQAHIHCGAPGVNGPVVAFLFGFDASGVTTNGTLSQGTLTNADVIPLASSAECPGGVANFDQMIARMQSGDAYVNIHTIIFPGGEIRGNL
jgi:CHRD domain